MNLYNEEDFYKEQGWPPEEYHYCDFTIPIDSVSEYGRDYDQFLLVVNALYPYLRLSKKRGHSQIPCGVSKSPSTDGWFAIMSSEERDEKCPKIAWGLAAWYMAYLSYSSRQQDYVLFENQSVIFKGYYDRFWNIYKENHSGLKYSKVTIEQKELDYLKGHIEIESCLWKKSKPLLDYPDLFSYTKEAVDEYEKFLLQRKQQIEDSIMPKRNCFSTEICTMFDTSYVKVFFLDDSIAPQAMGVVETLNEVRKVNITESKSSAHPGKTLTVYHKPMVDTEQCEKVVVEALNRFFNNEVVGNMHAHNEAKFVDIEKHILEYLDMASATIDVCVAWFTIDELRDKLLEKAKEGVKVRVIIYKDGVNHANGVDLTGLNHKEYRGERGGFMHDKFCVIDNVHTICGSYNWTKNAEEKNDEDAAFHREDYKFASEYTKRFNQMWERDGNDS